MNARTQGEHFQKVAQAFSYKAEEYDQFGQGHPNLERMRHKVYAHVLRFAPAQAHILELNAGTGTDAAYFSSRGYTVQATDIAPAMVESIQDKIERYCLQSSLAAQMCSFTDLSEVEGGPFDYIYSNFGGLNCIHDLTQVTHQLPALLRPGGRLTWVIMPPVCPWDLVQMVRGDFQQALRRLHRGGILANVAGVQFKVTYFTPSQVKRTLGTNFRSLALEGLSVFAPPADRKQFATRYPRLYQRLVWLDQRLAGWSPFNGWGDFFIYTAEYYGD